MTRVVHSSSTPRCGCARSSCSDILAFVLLVDVATRVRGPDGSPIMKPVVREFDYTCVPPYCLVFEKLPQPFLHARNSVSWDLDHSSSRLGSWKHDRAGRRVFRFVCHRAPAPIAERLRAVYDSSRWTQVRGALRIVPSTCDAERLSSTQTFAGISINCTGKKSRNCSRWKIQSCGFNRTTGSISKRIAHLLVARFSISVPRERKTAPVTRT